MELTNVKNLMWCARFLISRNVIINTQKGLLLFFFFLFADALTFT